MREPMHRELAAGRWATLSLAEQLGDVGSEVGRALKWRARNPKTARGALERALELIDLTLDDPRHRARPARLRELCRMREALLDFLVGENRYVVFRRLHLIRGQVRSSWQFRVRGLPGIEGTGGVVAGQQVQRPRMQSSEHNQRALAAAPAGPYPPLRCAPDPEKRLPCRRSAYARSSAGS
ncbi:MAG: hypothetical protein GF346_03645 [Candidatus Eisenbacteria bacterium]|nr:hypothetical protein [Candidatus Latescibacterota bacterium]MBD3301517.1 hypothetical protein [Candidatus Eisenbacteria bacterium]